MKAREKLQNLITALQARCDALAPDAESLALEIPGLSSGDIKITASALGRATSVLDTTKELVSVLGAEHKALESYYGVLANPTIIAASLPEELLVAIFELACTAEFTSASQTNASGRQMTPTDISRNTRDSICATCRRWRSVVLSSPRLWSEIGIHIPDIASRALRSPYRELITREILYSGASRLTLRINIGRKNQVSSHSRKELRYFKRSIWAEVCALLKPLAPRIESYSFECRELTGIDPFEGIMDGAARYNTFRVFQYSCWGMREWDYEPFLFDLSRFPALQVLDILDTTGAYLEFSLSPEGHRLHDLRIWGELGSEDVPKLLAANQETLQRAELLGLSHVNSISGSPVSLDRFPKLHTLSWDSFLPTIFLQGVAPRLQVLRFSSLADQPPRVSGIPNLRTLVFTGYAPEDAQGFLQAHNTVEELAASSRVVESLFSDISPESSHILPHLRRVYLDDTSAGGSLVESVKRVLELSRKRPSPFIVEVELPSNVSKELLLEYGELLRVYESPPDWAKFSPVVV